MNLPARLMIGLAIAGLVTIPKLATADEKAKALRYEPAVVELEGTVHVKDSPGAPNYDATSPTERWYYLQLAKPITVVGDKAGDPDDETESNLTQIQLIYIGAGRLVNRKVRLKGTLMHAITGHHHAPVLITPTSVEIVSAQ
jgi:hypothetical protein